VIPDAELVAEAWAKQNAAIAEVVSDHVATSLPKTLPPDFLRVVQVDVRGLVAETQDVALAFLQWDAYAYKGHKINPDWGKASLIARTLIKSMELERGVQIPGLGYVVDFASIFGPRKQPEATGWARFRVDAVMAMRPS
jgi:hypothetical protein